MSDLVLGVDGGGTKTVAWLAPLVDDGTDRIVGRGLAGPGNPRAAGFDAAQTSIDAAIDAAFADAGLPRTEVVAACFGLAGAGRPDEQQQITAWARRQGIAENIQVCGDAEPILAAATPDNCGIALIAGTGSLAWGRNQAGETARSGGWGYLMGDEGSGYAIALAGLRLAAGSADGREPRTQLLPRFQERLLAAAPDDLIQRVYAPSMTREGIAALSVEVFAAAADGDELAQLVVEWAAGDLAAMVAVLASRLRHTSGGYPLALTGSVLLNQQVLEAAVFKELQARGAAPQATLLVREPVRGALVMAKRLLARS